MKERKKATSSQKAYRANDSRVKKVHSPSEVPRDDCDRVLKPMPTTLEPWLSRSVRNKLTNVGKSDYKTYNDS